MILWSCGLQTWWWWQRNVAEDYAWREGFFASWPHVSLWPYVQIGLLFASWPHVSLWSYVQIVGILLEVRVQILDDSIPRLLEDGTVHDTTPRLDPWIRFRFRFRLGSIYNLIHNIVYTDRYCSEQLDWIGLDWIGLDYYNANLAVDGVHYSSLLHMTMTGIQFRARHGAFFTMKWNEISILLPHHPPPPQTHPRRTYTWDRPILAAYAQLAWCWAKGGRCDSKEKRSQDSSSFGFLANATHPGSNRPQLV